MTSEDILSVHDDNMSPLTDISYCSQMVLPAKKRLRMTSTRDKQVQRVELNEAKKGFEERQNLAIEEGARLYKHARAIDKEKSKDKEFL